MENLSKQFEELKKKIGEATCEQLKAYTYESIKRLIDHLDDLGVIDEESIKKIIVMLHDQIFYENILIDMIGVCRDQE